MRFAHLKRILKRGQLRLRGPPGAQDDFVLAAIAPSMRRLASHLRVRRRLPACHWQANRPEFLTYFDRSKRAEFSN